MQGIALHQALEATRKMVVDLVPPKLLPELWELGVGIDLQELNARHIGKVCHVLGGQCHAKAGVMRPTR